MPVANKFVEDLSRVISGAAGVAQGALSEAENAMKSRMGQSQSGHAEISREEFDAMSDMIKKARAENAQLRKEIDALSAQIEALAPDAQNHQNHQKGHIKIMMKLGRLALYGGGKMGMALLRGWLGTGATPNHIAVYDPEPSLELKDTRVQINPSAFEADIVILAVKPQIMPILLEETKLPNHALVISMAAGVNLASFEAQLGKSTRIIRAMPNTPAAIRAGITAIVGNAAASNSDMDVADNLLKAVGQVVRLENESDMDAVTGLSGSGPAYVFHMIEAMRAAGVAQGLSEDMSHKLALATVAGAGRLALETGTDPAELRKNVTSPGGTTEAGLKVLMNEKSGLTPLMTKTVAAAADRSRALGQNKS